MFASASPDPNALYQTLVIIQFVSGLVVSIAAAVAIFRKPPKQQREVNFAFEPASKKEFDEYTRVNDRMIEQITNDAVERRRHLYDKMEGFDKALRKEIREVATQMVSEVKSMSVEIAKVGTETKALTAQVAQLDQRFERTRGA